jgi:hypothetical protein
MAQSRLIVWSALSGGANLPHGFVRVVEGWDNPMLGWLGPWLAHPETMLRFWRINWWHYFYFLLQKQYKPVEIVVFYRALFQKLTSTVQDRFQYLQLRNTHIHVIAYLTNRYSRYRMAQIISLHDGVNLPFYHFYFLLLMIYLIVMFDLRSLTPPPLLNLLHRHGRVGLNHDIQSWIVRISSLVFLYRR